MLKKALALMIGTALVACAATILTNVTPSGAERGGCPNAASANGAAHADANSAHGLEKLADRSCDAANPTPTPAPTPTPVAEADVQVVNVFAGSPTSAPVAAPFVVSAQVNLLNNGSASTVLVDATFAPTLPTDCFATFGVVSVPNTSLPKGVGVLISRNWVVTCTQAGSHTFTFNVSAIIDPTQLVDDPDLSNNIGSAATTTQTN